MTGLVVCLAVLAVASAYGVAHRLRDGRIRMRTDDRVERLTSDDLGTALGERATLVQFSSAFCRPCVATRQVLDGVAARVDGVAHVEIDAELHLDLVRRLDVSSTPTTLVLDGDGIERRRAGGVPRRHEVLAALAELS